MNRVGVVCGLLAAALFGVSAPIAKLLLSDCSPQVLAGLLYLGAGLALSIYRLIRPRSMEASIRRSDIALLSAIVLLGGILAPVLMLVGLGRVSALAGSLLLNLEAPLTIVLAVLLFGEHLGRYAAMAALCILVGAVVLKIAPGQLGADLWGGLAIACACLLWGLDNNLTQRLSLRDPFALVRIKTLAAGSINLLLGFARGGTLPSTRVILGALALGALSYGVSVVLDAYALRLVGAAREAAYFATAPFVGALASTVILDERLGHLDLVAMTIMAVGVALLLRERHSHEHAHEALQHEHAHTHDEHHHHDHSASDPPGEPHSHPHRHAPLVHDHPHMPDLHHRHAHN